MAEYRCDACAKLVVKPATESPWIPHHRTLSELKSCAESQQHHCSMCRLLWTAIKRCRSEQNIQYHLSRCSANAESPRTEAYDPQLFLTIHLEEDPPDNPPHHTSGSPRDHRIPDMAQCIKITVNRIHSNWPYTILGAVNISVPCGKSKRLHSRQQQSCPGLTLAQVQPLPKNFEVETLENLQTATKES